MNAVFIDTSAFYALADKRDPAHKRGAEFIKRNALPLLTTNFVLAETMSLVTKRLGKRAAVKFGAGIWNSRVIELVFLSEEYQKQAWHLFCSQEDKEWDFIDCSCFVVMEKLGLTRAFTFDRHFSQRGLTMAPS